MREIAERFGFTKEQVQEFKTRYNKNQRKLAAGISIKPKGRPRKDGMDIPAWDLPLTEKIRECQKQCGRTYGYRRVHIWLERNGIYRNPKTVLRVMQKYGLLSVIRRKKYRNYGDYLHKYPNLLNRDFSAERPNQK